MPTQPRHNPSAHRHSSPGGGFSGLPTWSSTSILLASLFTGLVISLNQQSLGTLYLMAFAVGALVTVLWVEPRGLTLTVAQIPVIFGIATPCAALLLGKSNSVNGGDGRLSKTELLTLIYPLAQFFPTLIVVTLSAAAIAVLRYLHHRRTNMKLERKLSAQRKRASDSDRRNLSTTARAREAANRSRRYRGEAGNSEVTVEDLLERSRADHKRSKKRGFAREHQPASEHPSPHAQGAPHHPETPARSEAPTRARDYEEIRSPRIPRPHTPSAPSTPHTPAPTPGDPAAAARSGSAQPNSGSRPKATPRPVASNDGAHPRRGDAQQHRTRRIRRPDHENRFRRLRRDERGRMSGRQDSRGMREPRASRDFSTTRGGDMPPRTHTEGYRSEQRGAQDKQRNYRGSRAPHNPRRDPRREPFPVRPDDPDSYGFRTPPRRGR
ncbi:DUF6542 domain-containing protein [Corynebacterium sp. TAE3-ERU2]|uniref:DUF6542 domain-containing protein n=1 Tax=Corynebacterium sp. TAE3-ERU2 TaxID=2849497 RepID=UPI00351CEE71